MRCSRGPRIARLLLAAACLCGATGAAAQTTGALRGRVVDALGDGVAGARVVAEHLETSGRRGAATDPEGRFALPSLPIGRYRVTVEAEGLRPLVRDGIALAVGETVTLTLALEPGSVHEAITVTDAPPAVETHAGELGFLVEGRAVESLPLNGRNFTDLAVLQPNVQEFLQRDGGSVVAHGPGISVNGRDPRSNVYLLDGTLMNDFTNGPAGSAAGTSLGTETLREMRVETNAYGPEFGRNAGGQVTLLTKSGTNRWHGSAFLFHRNDRLDSRNYFDVGPKPDFLRNQGGGTVGGPIREGRLFLFLGVEHLTEDLGRTISTVVPDDLARQGLLPDPGRPGERLEVGVDSAVAPYLDAFPRANGETLGGGLAVATFPFEQRLREDFLQARVDLQAASGRRLFARVTLDDADQRLPTDFPQFPRSFRSRNAFLTLEQTWVPSASTLHTARLGYAATRIGQDVEVNLEHPLPPFVPGRPSLGDIDVGGIPRFGPQISADVTLEQRVAALEYAFLWTTGRHLVETGLLVERYDQREFNPTFSRGLFVFPSLERFLQSRPAIFIGLTPDADLERRWESWLTALFVRDDVRIGSRFTLNLGARWEAATVPSEERGRDVALPDLAAPEPTIGPLYRNPTRGNVSPRVAFAWDLFGDGRTALRGGAGVYYDTNIQQNLIVTITNPPFTPRPVIPAPRFPQPLFGGGSISIRPIQFDLESPEVTAWNLTTERQLPAGVTVALGAAGSRGRHLLRNSDINVPEPAVLPDGTPFFPAGSSRPNPAFSAIELKSSDGEAWYRALFVDVRRRFRDGFGFALSYTRSHSEDITQASTFFSDATNGTTSAFPESLGPGYNRGLSDFHARHKATASFTWELPFGRRLTGAAAAIFDGWQLSAIGRYRSGNPLTPFVQNNWSRSLWSPALGPGIGRDRPSYAPGRGGGDAVTGDPAGWFDPSAFVLPPAGTPGNARRGSLLGPDLQTLDLALIKTLPWGRLGDDGRVELRIEAFNVLDRANFGTPSLIVFTGTREGEEPLPSFGRIRDTVTAARQIQLGVRLLF
ncbi:MAG: TonB-dependent receptor [Thermoanaerobaculia bacterium]|nr:TonB-dependent receptor [Thermoanaerobaculia bacterium]